MRPTGRNSPTPGGASIALYGQSAERRAPLDQSGCPAPDVPRPGAGPVRPGQLQRSRKEPDESLLAQSPAWPDSVPGLYRLKHRYIIAPMSNGNIALMTNMAKNGGPALDCILGAEVAKHYSRTRKATRLRWTCWVCDRSGDDDGGASGDLLASQKVGLQTGFVPRPMEHGPNRHSRPDAGPLFQRGGHRLHGSAAQMGV